jgi:acetate kinase
LHNRAGLDGIAAARRVTPAGVRHVAVFDTAFHHTLTPSAAAFGGPFSWFEAGLRRYGFHGISHHDAARRAAGLLGRPLDQLRMITCHLGGGCSVTAVAGGRSVDTTMGLTPLDGLVMTTRAGSVDPGLLLHLLRRGDSVEAIEDTLERRSGLAGLSGTSGDLRDVIAARDRGDQRATLAIDVFVHRIASGIGAMLAAVGRLDAIVFTGGIGQHSAEVRARVVERFDCLGAAVDTDRNNNPEGDAVVSTSNATVAVIVVAAREEAAIARSVAALTL